MITDAAPIVVIFMMLLMWGRMSEFGGRRGPNLEIRMLPFHVQRQTFVGLSARQHVTLIAPVWLRLMIQGCKNSS